MHCDIGLTWQKGIELKGIKKSHNYWPCRQEFMPSGGEAVKMQTSFKIYISALWDLTSVKYI